jgi:hypothetical protein
MKRVALFAFLAGLCHQIAEEIEKERRKYER